MANYHQDFDSFYKTNAKDYLKFKQRKHLEGLKDPAFNYSMFFIKTDWCSITTIVEAMFRLNTEVNMLSKLVLRPRINMTCPSLKHFKDLC